MDTLNFFADHWSSLLSGAATAILITVATVPLVLAIAATTASLRVFAPRAVAFLPACYVLLFRGTPLLVQVFWIFYALPFVGIRLDPIPAGILALALNFGAYSSEILRGALKSVHRGQLDAATMLGLKRSKTIRRVIIPQALVIATPALINQTIELFKNTSVLGLIAVVELVRQGRDLLVLTNNPLAVWLLVAAFYLVIAVPASRAMRRLEKRSSARIATEGGLA